MTGIFLFFKRLNQSSVSFVNSFGFFFFHFNPPVSLKKDTEPVDIFDLCNMAIECNAISSSTRLRFLTELGFLSLPDAG